MTSLRSRLLGMTAVGTTLVLVACGILLYFLVSSALVAEVDRLLVDKAKGLANLTEEESGSIDFEFDEDGGPEEYRRTDQPEYYEAWLADGTVLSRSRSLGESDLPRVMRLPGQPACFALTLPDGRSGRAAGLRFLPRREIVDETATPSAELPTVELVVARDTESLDRTLARLRWLLVGVGGLAMLLCLGTLAFVVQGGLRPLRAMAARIRGIGDKDLSVRIDLRDVPAEVLPIGRRLNAPLGHREDAFEKERAFSSNVAHELRTPLAGLRATLEVALMGPPDPEHHAEAMDDCLSICDQTESMVENLLALARCETGQVRIDLRSVDVGALIEDVWKPIADRARSRRLQVEQTIDSSAVVETDPEKLRIVVQNLLSNSVSHSEASGRVAIAASRRNGGFELRVANTANGLEPAEVAHVFDRFWRGDSARGDTGVHRGLGLALCREITHVLGGTITANVTADGEFEVVLRL